jgi:hypothetical protein
VKVHPRSHHRTALDWAGEGCPLLHHPFSHGTIYSRYLQCLLIGFMMHGFETLCEIFVELLAEGALSQSSYLLCEERLCVNNDILTDVKSTFEITSSSIFPFLLVLILTFFFTFFFLVISCTFSLERLKTHEDISSNYNRFSWLPEINNM